MDENDRWVRVLSHRERLLRLARARLPRVDDAEDVVQEAMIRTATFGDLDEERLGEFLTTVTIRLCIDEWRRAARASNLAQRIPAERFEEPGVDERICALAEAAWAATMVALLPATQQEVLYARADGMSYEEISRRRRLSFKAVESAASRARTTMRTALAATLSSVCATRMWHGRRQVATSAIVAVAACGAVAVAPRAAVRVDPVPAASPAAQSGPRPRPGLVPTAARSSAPPSAIATAPPATRPPDLPEPPSPSSPPHFRFPVPTPEVPTPEVTPTASCEPTTEGAKKIPERAVGCLERTHGGGG